MASLKRNPKRVLKTRKKNKEMNLIKSVFRILDKGLKILDDILDFEWRI